MKKSQVYASPLFFIKVCLINRLVLGHENHAKLSNKARVLRDLRHNSTRSMSMFRLFQERLNFMLLGLYGLANSEIYVQIYHLLYILHSPHINKLYNVEHTPTLVSCTLIWTGGCFSIYVKPTCNGVTNIYQATTGKQHKW